MTETATLFPATTTDDWDTQFPALKICFPKVKDTILFAFFVLQSNPDVAMDDLKAQSKMHGIRVTAASVNAARRLLDRNPATGGEAESPATNPAPAKPRRTRQRRDAQAPLDVDGIIRSAVAKVQSQGEAELDRLRAAMRKAIAVLEAATS